MRRRPARAVVVAATLVVVLGGPALALAALWRWADERATAAETAADDETAADGETAAGTDRPAAPAAPTLATSMISFRRVPEPLAERAAERLGAEELERLLDEVLDGAADASCAAVVAGDAATVTSGTSAGVDALAVQRLLIASVALEVLGPDHRFVTSVLSPPIVDGVAQGDLVLVGGGDPLLRTADDTGDAVDAERSEFSTEFDTVADQIAEAGVVRVEGDLVGDGTRYDDEFSVPSWGIGIPRGVGGPYGALLVNRGRLFGAGYGLNPTQSAANELNRLLGQRGVAVSGRNRSAVEPATGRDDLTVIAEVESAALVDIVGELMRVGDPNIAELLVKELAVAEGHSPGSRIAGLEVVRERLAERGIDVAGLELEDASALSVENRVTCAQLAQVLAWELPDGPVIGTLLPAADLGIDIGGIDIGSIEGDQAGGVFVGAVASRPGAASMAGLLTDRSGQPLSVAVVLADDRIGLSDEERGDTGGAWESDSTARWERLLSGLSSLPPDVPLGDFAPR